MESKEKTLLQIIKNGGGNLKNWNQVSYSSGYMVAIKKGAIIDIKDIKAIIEFIDSVNGSCGLWVNNGFMYIDISINIESKEEALKLASDLKELAIFDCANMKDIPLEK